MGMEPFSATDFGRVTESTGWTSKPSAQTKNTSQPRPHKKDTRTRRHQTKPHKHWPQCPGNCDCAREPRGHDQSVQRLHSRRLFHAGHTREKTWSHPHTPYVWSLHPPLTHSKCGSRRLRKGWGMGGGDENFLDRRQHTQKQEHLQVLVWQEGENT